MSKNPNANIIKNPLVSQQREKKCTINQKKRMCTEYSMLLKYMTNRKKIAPSLGGSLNTGKTI